MKKGHKILLMAACAVLLVCISVGATVAYLTSTDEVTNTFTVGKVAITLDEAKTNVDGEPLKDTKDEQGNVKSEVVARPEDATRVQGNRYKLLPGHTYIKDPTIRVSADSEPCYLFVKVENGIADIEDEENTIENYMLGQNWVKLGESHPNIWFRAEDFEEGQTPVPAKYNAGSNVVIFPEFTIAESVLGGTKPDNPAEGALYIEDYKDATIKITAYAIQADGFANSTPEQIWQAIGE